MSAPNPLSCGATSSAELIRKQPRLPRSFNERSMTSSMKRRTACLGGSVFFEPPDPRARRPLKIALERLHEKVTLVAEEL